MKVVIPMSGKGQRFIDKGYKVPKPLIEVDSKPIIEHIVNMFDKYSDEFIFICNSTHLKETNMREILETIVPNGKIIEVEPHKFGPVYAVLKAQDLILDNEPVIVNYCDFNVNWDYNDFKNKMIETNCDGCVPSYTGFHPHLLDDSTLYGGVKIDENNFMTDYKEKHCFEDDLMDGWHSAGTYYFRKGEILKKYFNKIVELDINYNGEYYASIPYYLMLEDKLPIYVYSLKHFMQWGTPKDLEEYNYWSDLFTKIAKNEISENEFLNQNPVNQKIFHYWKDYFNENSNHIFKEDIFSKDLLEHVILSAGALIGGDYALKNQLNAKIEKKVSDDLVSLKSSYVEEKSVYSQIDVDVQNLILSKIGETFQKRMNVIVEEESLETDSIIEKYFLRKNEIINSGYTLVIDPIDGSANYLSKNKDSPHFGKRNPDFWGISVLILKDLKPVVGVIYYPALNIVLSSQKDIGTYLNGEKVSLNQDINFSEDLPIRVSSTIDLKNNNFKKSEHTGSLVVTLLSVLNSDADLNLGLNLPECFAYIGKNTNIVDLGIGTLLFSESNGECINFDGENFNPFEFLVKKNNEIYLGKEYILAPNKKFGNSLIEEMKK